MIVVMDRAIYPKLGLEARVRRLGTYLTRSLPRFARYEYLCNMRVRADNFFFREDTRIYFCRVLFWHY